MERYEQYKDSGVDWIGEIPEGWGVSLLKRYCNVTDGSHYSPKSQLTGRPYVSVKDVGVNCINLDNCNKISEDDFILLVNSGCSPKADDVLLTKDGTIGRAAVVTEAYKQFVVLSSLGILSPNKKVYSNFLYLYLISGINIDQMYSTIHGSALTRLTIDKINNLIFVCPPKSEQTDIANYLDLKTAEIDKLIAQKERLLELYEEAKAAIINQAVTQGINPDVKLKDSGIDWLGEIPEHWEVKKLKYVTMIISKGTTPSTIGRSTTSDGDIRFIKAENIANNKVVSEPSKYIDDTTNEILKRSQLFENDILFVIAGATIGKVAILKKEFTPANTNQAVSFIRLHNLKFVKFIWYWLQSNKINGILWLDAVQSAQPNLSMENLGNFYVLFPELFEQTAIVQHIESETTRINSKITKIKKTIALQKEYRTALISEVVTGKIKVTPKKHGEITAWKT